MTETHASQPAGPHGSDAMTGPHGSADDHGADHGHDDHAHSTDSLGPIDLQGWAAGVLGVVLGLVVFVAIALAAGAIG